MATLAIAFGLVSADDAPRMAATGAAVTVSPVLRDPFPISRIRVTDEQLAEAIRPFDAETLIRLPRKEFEARVQKSARAVAERPTPQILDARYAADFVNGNLSGEAEWTILNSQSAPAFLPIESPKIALHSGHWSDGGEAVMGIPGLWSPPGRHVMKLKWSAAGNGAAGDRQFDLRLPGGSSSSLDLSAPSDHSATTGSDVLMTGPFPDAARPQQRIWRVRFGERPRLDLQMRGPSESSTTVLAAAMARYDVTPGRIACTFEFDLRTTHGSANRWTFALSPTLTVLDAVANDRLGWQVDPASQELQVRLRQPTSAGKVVISALAPAPGQGKSNPLPTLQAAHALLDEDRIEIRVHPDLELEHLDNADYRLMDSSQSVDNSRQVSLVGALVPAGTTTRRPPSIRVATTEAEFTTQEALEWKMEGERVRLSARTEVRVRRGPLFRVSFQVPQAFQLGRLSTRPEESVSFTRRNGSLLEVELSRPLTSGQRVELDFEWEGERIGPTVLRVPFPQFHPIGAAERDGWVSFSPHRHWSMNLQSFPGAVPASDLDWPDRAPADAKAAYFFRSHEPAGEIVLSPLSPIYTAQVEMRFAAEDFAQIKLNVWTGSLNGITVFEPPSQTIQRKWKLVDSANSIASITSIATNVLSSAVGSLAVRVREPGTFWFIQFTHPATGEVILESTAQNLRDSATPEALRVLGASESHAAVQPNGSEPTKQSSSGPWRFDDLHLLTLVTESHALVVFGGMITSRGGEILPLSLPDGVEFRAACIGGHWLDAGRCEPIDRTGGPLRLPIPAATGPIPFEVRYRVPMRGDLLRTVQSPAPSLPGELRSLARWWLFSTTVASAWPSALKVSATEELPKLLGEPLVRDGSEITFSRYAGTEVHVVPTRRVDVLAAVLTAIGASLAWLGVWSNRRSLGFLLLGLALVGGAIYWLGPSAWQRAAGPPLVAALLGIIAIIVAPAPPNPRDPSTAIRKSGSSGRISIRLGIVLGGVIAPITARAQIAADRDVVFLVAGKAEEIVVAPKAILDRLEADPARSGPAVLLTSATYEGVVEDNLARFTGRYVVHSFRDDETAVELPLADVRLEQMKVDGKPAAPAATRPDLYTATVRERGRHEIVIQFAVPIGVAGPEREVKFGIPEVFDNRLSFDAPVAARQLQTVSRLGEQTTTSNKTSLRLEAFLGNVRTVHLRWREGAAGTATVAVREGCVWDLSATGHTLTACYQMRIDTGSISMLRFDLSAELEPVRVAVRSLDGLLVRTALRDWSIGTEAGGLRPLRLNLNGPTDGRLLVTVECLPRGAPTRQPVLHFPRPIGMTRTDALYALRTTGVSVDSVVRTGVIDFAADALVRDFGAVADLRLSPNVPLTAFASRTGEFAELRPVLRSTHEPPTLTQETTWNVTPGRADGTGTIKWNGKEAVPLLQFGFPAPVQEIRGIDLSSWAQTGGRVQVWLKKPVREGTIEWSASLAPPEASNTSPWSFQPPIPTFSDARVMNQMIHLRVAEGWAVDAVSEPGWSPFAANERMWSLQTEGTQPGPRWRLFPPNPGRPRGMGLIDLSGPEAGYRTTLAVLLAPNRPHHLRVRAGIPSAIRATLDVPIGVRTFEEKSDDYREWSLDIPASNAAAFRMTLTFHFPAKGTLALPPVTIVSGDPEPGGSIVQWLGIIDGQQKAKLEGVTAADLTGIQDAWPGEADRLRRVDGSVWKVTSIPRLVFAESSRTRSPQPTTDGAPSQAASDDAVALATDPYLFAAFAWCCAIIATVFLFVRLPQATWPEQVGLLGAMLSFILMEGLALGIGIYAAARTAWLVRKLTNGPSS